MEDIVNEYDFHEKYTDIFYFHGASNVQLGGKILEAAFPHTYSLHGGEHVVSLFFSDLAKLKPIKVSVLFYFYH